MKVKLFALVLSLALLGAFQTARASTVDVTYTVSGSPGNWTYNFSVSNNITVAQNIYFLGVLTPGTVSASPANWVDFSSNAATVNSNNQLAGASSIGYNNMWAVNDVTGPDTIFPTHSLSGFGVTDTSSVALTSISFFVLAVSSTLDLGIKIPATTTDCFNCVTNCHEFDCGWNPGFEGLAVSSLLASETPLPGALSLFAGGLGAIGLLGWRRKRKLS